jgi:hypothetical protein
MALAMWCLPSVQGLLAQATARAGCGRATWWLRSAALAAMGLTVAISPLWAGRVYRDGQLIRDVERIARIVPPRATLVVPPSMENEWSLQAYLYRLHHISVETTDALTPSAYHLDFVDSPQDLPNDFTLIDAGLTLYRLSKPSNIAALGDDPPNR